MKKILLSILAIALTVGTVSASAYALFTTTETVSGITITSGNADLVIYDGGTTTEISGFVGSLNGKLANLYPKFKDYTNVDFKNTSTSNIGLNLKMQLTNAGGNWNELKDKVYIAISPKGVEPTNWYTLAQWNANPISFGGILAHDDTADSYRFSIAVADNAGNEIAGKSISNVTFVITGTQAE